MSGGLLGLVRLLQLASPVLPIGAYSYSQGIEWAVEAGTIRDGASAQHWVGDLMEFVLGPGEAAVFWRCAKALAANDADEFAAWNAWFRASRETSELRAETEQMGAALVKLLGHLGFIGETGSSLATTTEPVTMPAAFALAAHNAQVPAEEALTGYLWSWLENQVIACVKTVPLGQVAGQRLLLALGARIPSVVATAQAVADEDVGSFAPGLAIASARHETQYTRLFRS